MLLIEDGETRLQACATAQTDFCGELTHIMHRCANPACICGSTGPQMQPKREIRRAKHLSAHHTAREAPFSFRNEWHGTDNWPGEHAVGRKNMIRPCSSSLPWNHCSFDIWATNAQTYGTTKPSYPSALSVIHTCRCASIARAGTRMTIPCTRSYARRVMTVSSTIHYGIHGHDSGSFDST
jgi:hypothetical protein